MTDEVRDNNEWFNALREAQVEAGPDLAIYGIAPLQRELRRFEDRLELVKAKPRATDLNPNCWYVRRRNDEVPDSYMLVDEPTYSVIDDLKSRDLWGVDIRQRLRAVDQTNARRAAAVRREQADYWSERTAPLDVDRLSVTF